MGKKELKEQHAEFKISVNSLGTSINKNEDGTEIHFRGILTPSNIHSKQLEDRAWQRHEFWVAV